MFPPIRTSFAYQWWIPGCGITAEARALIFERLYQDPNAVDNSRKGLGLGLFIARELITLHGGRIWVASDGATGSTFSFTLPVYSLPKLLAPVVTYQNRLREAFVLVKVDLQPRCKPPRGNWKDICKHARELLERCVYLDKDLVLPPMASSGPEQTLFVVASTDLKRSAIMTTRIREQMEKVPDLGANGTFEISASDVPLAQELSTQKLEMQVQEIAERVTEMMRDSLGAQSVTARQ